MKLYLAQHGEACTKDIDPERPLTDQGREDIERLAEFLARKAIEVERVIASGKLRAAETADLLAAAVASLVEPETSDRINPNDDPSAFDWEQATGGQDTLVDCHLPFMARQSGPDRRGPHDPTFRQCAQPQCSLSYAFPGRCLRLTGRRPAPFSSDRGADSGRTQWANPRLSAAHWPVSGTPGAAGT